MRGGCCCTASVATTTRPLRFDPACIGVITLEDTCPPPTPTYRLREHGRYTAIEVLVGLTEPNKATVYQYPSVVAGLVRSLTLDWDHTRSRLGLTFKGVCVETVNCSLFKTPKYLNTWILKLIVN